MELLTIPAIIALIEVLKMAGLPSKYAPLVSVLIGGGLGYSVGSLTGGILIGLSASGLYSSKVLIK